MTSHPDCPTSFLSPKGWSISIPAWWCQPTRSVNCQQQTAVRWLKEKARRTKTMLFIQTHHRCWGNWRPSLARSEIALIRTWTEESYTWGHCIPHSGSCCKDRLGKKKEGSVNLSRWHKIGKKMKRQLLWDQINKLFSFPFKQGTMWGRKRGFKINK